MKSLSRDGVWGLGLALAALLLRLPFRSRFLYHWDSVNFALSLEHYDVRLHQPHPPGYFLYSMLGQLVNSAVHDANASLVWICLVSGVLGVVALYWLGTVMFDRRVGVVAALLALANPLQWFYSDVALSYSPEFLLVTLVAGLCYLQLTGRRQGWVWSAILLGIAGGIRQNDLAFLLPLWLASLWPLPWRQRLASLAILAGVVTAWAWPMMALSGGLAGYMAALGSESSGVASESPLFSLRELGLNGARMVVYLGYALLLGVLPLLWGAWELARTARAHLSDRRAWTLVLWIGPAAGFYTVVHLRQHGHIFTFLPALILLTALALTKLGERIAGTDVYKTLGKAPGPGWLAAMLTALLVLVEGAFFLFGPASLFGSNQLPLQTPSRETITQRDRFLGERIAAIRANFEPESTIILAGSFNFRHPDYYLREYQDTSLSYRLGDDLMTLPDSVHALVLFDDAALPQSPEDSRFQRLPLPDGGSLCYLTWNGDQQVKLNLSSIEVEAK
jgi:4-amino-4-deoxy-L-arabinose transferase-like glycosyltransferase